MLNKPSANVNSQPTDFCVINSCHIETQHHSQFSDFGFEGSSSSLKFGGLPLDLSLFRDTQLGTEAFALPSILELLKCDTNKLNTTYF